MLRESVLDCLPDMYSAFIVNSIGVAITSSAAKTWVESSCFDSAFIELNVHLESPSILTESKEESRERTTSFSMVSPLFETKNVTSSILPAFNKIESSPFLLSSLSKSLILPRFEVVTVFTGLILKTDSGGFGDITMPIDLSVVNLVPYASLYESSRSRFCIVPSEE